MQDNLSQVIKALPNEPILLHSRCLKTDIDAVLATKAPWIGLWLSFNDISLSSKFTKKNLADIFVMMKESIDYAKSKNLKIRFSIEDASRTPAELIQECAHIAMNSGACQLSLADTVGAWEPKSCYNTIKNLKQNTDINLSIHLHNDQGLAMANAIAAIDAGVNTIDTSICGIGERAGIIDLITLANYLARHKNQNDFALEKSHKLVNLFEKITGYQDSPQAPFTGRYAFAHTSSYHKKAVNNNPNAYEHITPQSVGKLRREMQPTKQVKTDRVAKLFNILRPFKKGASELPYHRDGYGERYILIDNRLDSRSRLYWIMRVFKNDKDSWSKLAKTEQQHVDGHQHDCASVFCFWGADAEGKGLTVSVTIGEETQEINSPAVLFIPAYTWHTYSYVSGSGQYFNLVLSPSYHNSLYDL